MAFDVDKLTALYESQSPAAFIAYAMEGLPQDFTHDERFDKAEDERSDDTPCSYCCCNDKGCCSTPGWYACLGGCIVVCCACCCYVTNGFNGIWTYWPF